MNWQNDQFGKQTSKQTKQTCKPNLQRKRERDGEAQINVIKMFTNYIH